MELGAGESVDSCAAVSAPAFWRVTCWGIFRLSINFAVNILIGTVDYFCI